jgi:hypothetical protein
VDADLETFATALCVKIDDALRTEGELVRPRPNVGIAPKLSDAELITLGVRQTLLGFTSVARRSATPPSTPAISQASELWQEMANPTSRQKRCGRGRGSLGMMPELAGSFSSRPPTVILAPFNPRESTSS